MNIYWILMIILVGVAAFTTVRIANSQENKQADRRYSQGTRVRLVQLTLFYVILTGIGGVLFIYFLLTR